MTGLDQSITAATQRASAICLYARHGVTISDGIRTALGRRDERSPIPVTPEANPVEVIPE
jgi:hypothetical protein